MYKPDHDVDLSVLTTFTILSHFVSRKEDVLVCIHPHLRQLVNTIALLYPFFKCTSLLIVIEESSADNVPDVINEFLM